MDATEIIAQQQEQENSSVFFSTSGLNESGKTTGGIMNNGVNSKTGGKESNVSWIADYVRGADFEVYYVSLSSKYKSAMGFIWPLMAEGIYLEFGAMLVGVCCKSAMSMILNPSHLETSVYPSLAGESPIMLLLYPLCCVIYPYSVVTLTFLAYFLHHNVPSHDLHVTMYRSWIDFYREHDTGVLMCESYAIAAYIAQSLESDEVIGTS